MSDLKLFRLDGESASEITGAAMALEKPLQTLIERNMEAFFGARLVASEYSTGKKHAGRIDSLGLDENGSPVIFEYKRATNQNVINQGLRWERHRILCAHRAGPRGVRHWSDIVERWLIAQDPSITPRLDGYYPGQPPLVTTNDYENGLYNGDTDVVVDVGDGLFAAFRRGARAS